MKPRECMRVMDASVWMACIYIDSLVMLCVVALVVMTMTMARWRRSPQKKNTHQMLQHIKLAKRKKRQRKRRMVATARTAASSLPKTIARRRMYAVPQTRMAPVNLCVQHQRWQLQREWLCFAVGFAWVNRRQPTCKWIRSIDDDGNR